MNLENGVISYFKNNVANKILHEYNMPELLTQGPDS